jgi:delta8-fatty-acid desaturase
MATFFALPRALVGMSCEALARPWLQVLFCATCLVLAAARTPMSVIGNMDEASLGAQTLSWASIIAAGSLLMQLLFVQPAGDPQVHEVNKDKSLTWREDEGVSKLAPTVPERITERKAKAEKPLERYTMAEVAKHNSRESLWIVIDTIVYDCTKYVDRHPGGALMLENMAGKDCTDVFANYHSARIYKQMLPPMVAGEVTDVVVPPHVEDFRQVRQELLRRGLFETDYGFYAKLGTWLAALWLAGIYLSVGCTSTTARMGGAIVIGLFWQQLAGIGHDMGHSGVTHVFWLDHVLSSCLVSLMGISVCWWKKNHNTHHIVCNSIEHDPDIQHMPAFAVTPGVWDKPYWSTYYTKWVHMDAIARLLVSYQHFLFYPIMMVARFNLYAQSLIQLFSKEPLHYRRLELCAFVVYFSWAGGVALSQPTWGQSLGWLLLSHAVSGLLHVQICISHFSMETYHGHAYNDEKDEWYITQIKTTMNVDTPECLDFVHIGLQHQTEHHLFPRLPRHNLRKARELVRGVCEKHGLFYREHGFLESNLRTLRAMYQTAQVARTSTKGSNGFYESPMWAGLTLDG